MKRKWVVLLGVLCFLLFPLGVTWANDNKDAPIPVQVNETISASQESSFINYYVFTINSPSKVQIELNETKGSSYVSIGRFNEGQYENIRSDYTPFVNDALGYAHFEMVPFRLEPGQYYVALSTDKNKWDLTIHCWDEAMISAERAPNDRFETATEMTLNTEYKGNNSFAGSDKADYYRFTLTSPGSVTYALSYPEGENKECLKYVTLYNAMGEELQSIKCRFNSYDKKTYHESTPYRLPAGQYYLKVNEYIGTSWNYAYDYGLTLNFKDESGGGYEVESNGTFSAANDLSLGKSVKGSQNNIDDEDLFRIRLLADGPLKLTFSCDFTDNETHCVRLFDENGTQIGKKWNVPNESTTTLTTDSFKAGIYYVQVADYEYIYWTSVPYELTVSPLNEVSEELTPTQPSPTGVISSPVNGGEAYTKATALKQLGLFEGVSSTDFALNRKPTRVEALVMFVRLLGAEEEATREVWPHPFIDVPSWADRYVGYAYQMGYTQGVTYNRFGSNQTATADMYLTFMLRALAYSEGIDFTWKNASGLAQTIDLLPQTVNTREFLREDIALISWAALSVPMKAGNKGLGDLLVMKGVFTQNQLDYAYQTIENTNTSGHNLSMGSIKYGTYVCKMDAYGSVYDAAYRPKVTLKSDGTFDFLMNFGEGMLTVRGTYIPHEDDVYGVALLLTVTSQHEGVVLEPTYLLTADFGPNRIGLTNSGAGITPVESVFEYVGE